MAGEADDTSWLEIEPAAPQNPPSAATPPPAVASDDDWLKIEDPNAGVLPLPFRALIDQCMRGTNRVMASDGQYMVYRPFNREFDKETNPRTMERVRMFLADGKWKHLGTYDEVQVYELLEGNAYRHSKKQYVIGKNYRDDITKVAEAACNRQWVDYHDLLLAMATALKAGRDPLFAKTMWDDTLTHIVVRIQQIGGPAAPSEKEINEGFVEVRKARGIQGRHSLIALPPANTLQRVGFTK